MPDQFSICEITPIGASFKVLRDGVNHREAIGIGDFATVDDYADAVLAKLDGYLRVDPKTAEIAALEGQKTAITAKLTELKK